jgi:GAF domain
MTHVPISPLMRAWQRGRIATRPLLPRPEDAPQAQAPGPDPDRVLLIGTGPAVGWGVRTHELALTGYLARELAAFTGRGAAVETRAEPDLPMGSLHLLLDDLRLWRFDTVVVVGGMHDAVSLTSARRWRLMMTALIDRLESEMSPDSPILVLGIQPATSVSTYASWPGVVADRHVTKLNRVTEAICARRDRVHFAPLPVPSEGPTTPGSRGPRLYREWGRSIAESLAPILSMPPRPSFARSLRAEREPESERQHAVDATGILRSGHDIRFDRIASLARDVFSSEYAAVTIVDNDRQWNKAAIGLDIEEAPRAYSFCDGTIASDGPLVYGDLAEDARFDDNPFVQDDPNLRFYAGYPIESPDGYRIGALCVMDSAPRDPSTVDTSALRELALLVQKEIWAVAAGPVAQPEAS